MHLTSDNIGIIIYDKADEVIKEPFESLFNRYQTGLETSMRDSDFAFDCVNLLHYRCHKVNLKRGKSYIDYPVWIKKATINPVNDDDNCFQYAAKLSFNIKN